MRLYFFKNKVVEKSMTVKSWTDAEKKAKAMGMRLATTTERKEYLLKKDKEDEERKQKILKNPNMLHVQLVSSLWSPDGYGNTARYYHKNCIDHGVLLDEKYDFQDIGLCYFPPAGMYDLRTKVKVLFTMFESTRFPSEWEKAIRHADYIVTPTTFCRDVILKQYNIQSVVIPLGYDEAKFRPIRRVRRKSDPYVFLHYDAFKKRKGWHLILNAFTEEFTEKDNVKLIFKAIEGAKHLPLQEYKNIEVIKANYEHEEFLALHKRADCFVFPALGEGFGLTPLEAMRTGLHTIASYHTGMKDFVRPTLTKFTPVTALYDRVGLRGCDERQNLGAQFVCDHDQLKAEMRKAYEGRLHGEYPEIADLTMKNSLSKLAMFLKEISILYKLRKSILI